MLIPLLQWVQQELLLLLLLLQRCCNNHHIHIIPHPQTHSYDACQCTPAIFLATLVVVHNRTRSRIVEDHEGSGCCECEAPHGSPWGLAPPLFCRHSSRELVVLVTARIPQWMIVGTSWNTRSCQHATSVEKGEWEKKVNTRRHLVQSYMDEIM